MTALTLALLLSAYDPLVVADGPITPLALTVTDTNRHREVPLLLYAGPAKGPLPVVLFSHGLGGSNRNDVFLGEHWARRGYVAVFIQHAGSDEHVWKDVARGERMGAMKGAASLENFLARVEDVPVVIDALSTWTADAKHALAGRLDLRYIGMSGHSFGAVTTQAVSGQRFPFGKDFTDPRIKAAVAFSPSVPRRGSTSDAFGKVAIPWLLMTGTNDEAPIGGQTAASRRGVYPALPSGSKYELVLDGAEHSAFSDRELPGDKLPRNPNHHRVMRAFTTAFFDAYLKGDAAARAWLDGEGAKALLEKGDGWKLK